MARSIAGRTAAEYITSFLSNRKRPVTAEFISEKTGLNVNTVRTTLGVLAGSRSVEIAGRETPSKGRPANLYKLAA